MRRELAVALALGCLAGSPLAAQDDDGFSPCTHCHSADYTVPGIVEDGYWLLVDYLPRLERREIEVYEVEAKEDSVLNKAGVAGTTRYHHAVVATCHTECDIRLEVEDDRGRAIDVRRALARSPLMDYDDKSVYVAHLPFGAHRAVVSMQSCPSGIECVPGVAIYRRRGEKTVSPPHSANALTLRQTARDLGIFEAGFDECERRACQSSRLMGELAEGETGRHLFSISAGDDVAVLALCDEWCTNIDILVQERKAGGMRETDTLDDDFPLIYGTTGWAPGDTDIQVNISMKACAGPDVPNQSEWFNGKCSYIVGVYTRD